MMEIPEARVIAGQLNDTVRGKTIWSVVAAQSPHAFAWYFGDPKDYPDKLTGKQLGEARAYAGMVEIEADDMRILLDDGINIRYLEPGKPRPKKHQLLINFGDKSSLVFSVQMYGGISVYREGEDKNGYHLGARQKINPLDDMFDEAYFRSLINEDNKKLSIKGFLATEQRIPGLGNGVLQDILYSAGLSPMRKFNTLSDEEISALYASIKTTLREMLDLGGRDVERDIFGDNGGYITKLSRNTCGHPCLKCGSEIKKKAFLGGSVYFCESCQK